VKRRTFMQGMIAVPVIAYARPDTLPLRRATFEEVGNSVLVTMTLPALFRRYDREALASIDSGFDTTIHYVVKVWQHGKNRLVDTREVRVKIRRDPWKKRYVVSTREDSGWTKRTFVERDEAIAAAVKLDRVRVCAASDLERGEGGPYYFVTVLALRNPIVVKSDGDRSSGRGQGRDLEWFGRLVEVLAGERAQAEEVVHVKTNAFYLVER
jgi:hypothetical protein